jgi:hypothetical protein
MKSWKFTYIQIVYLAEHEAGWTEFGKMNTAMTTSLQNKWRTPAWLNTAIENSVAWVH